MGENVAKSRFRLFSNATGDKKTAAAILKCKDNRRCFHFCANVSATKTPLKKKIVVFKFA